MRITEIVNRVKRQVKYLVAEKDVRKYMNKDGSTNYGAIVSLCTAIEKELNINGRAEV